MQAFISSNVAISSSNDIRCDQQVVSGTASRAGTARPMRPRLGHTPSALSLQEALCALKYAPLHSSLPGQRRQDRLQGRLDPSALWWTPPPNPSKALSRTRRAGFSSPVLDPAFVRSC
jgi:hypothetical protein